MDFKDEYNQTFNERYSQLNPAQQIAVDTIEGPVLVIAGAGTGKTQLLSVRVANILKNTDISARNILCLTFTESAAYNMRTRLRSIIGIEADRIEVNTFHGLGTEIINANPDYFYKGAHFSPADDLAKLEIIQTILDTLDSTNPLKSFHPQEGWIFAKDLIQRIGDLKRGGLTPLEYRQILDSNKVFIDAFNPVFSEAFNTNITQFKQHHAQELAEKLEQILEECLVKTRVENSQKSDFIEINGQRTTYYLWGSLFVRSYNEALQEAIQNKYQTKPIREWRDKWGKKDGDNAFQLKDCLEYTKQITTAHIYEQYQNALYERGLFDFDDMLLEVIEAMRNNDDLRYHYQERFQYILVDEFQDTNGAQMALVNCFINTEITNNRPNILVVGDDDQSIFKFQGANLNNIIAFKDVFDDVAIITLNYNYRSTQDILDFASEVIALSSERLAYLEGVDKQLISFVTPT